VDNILGGLQADAVVAERPGVCNHSRLSRWTELTLACAYLTLDGAGVPVFRSTEAEHGIPGYAAGDAHDSGGAIDLCFRWHSDSYGIGKQRETSHSIQPLYLRTCSVASRIEAKIAQPPSVVVIGTPAGMLRRMKASSQSESAPMYE